MSLSDKVKVEDLTAEQKDVADVIGLEVYIKLSKLCGGSYIYIPKIESLERVARNESIRSEYTGYNLKELARKYNLTEVSIRNIVEDIRETLKRQPIEGQITLFDK